MIFRPLLLLYIVFDCMLQESFLVETIVCLIQGILFVLTREETMAGQEQNLSAQRVYWDSLQEDPEQKLVCKNQMIWNSASQKQPQVICEVTSTFPQKKHLWNHLYNLQVALLLKIYFLFLKSCLLTVYRRARKGLIRLVRT